MRELQLPSRSVLVEHVAEAFDCYWPTANHHVHKLPIEQREFVGVDLPLCLVAIRLPDWASSCGVDGSLLVPAEACGAGDDWHEVDWWLAAFLLLEAWHEREFERRHGPIHSYSYRLDGWDARAWDRAWANRIAMFLRAWAARAAETSAETLFGNFPAAEVTMTHDVDAVRKTLPIRMKQAVFNTVNALRHITNQEFGEARRCVSRAMRFLFGAEDWWRFDDLLAVEAEAGIRSRFHFYADGRRRTPIRWLFDPGYNIEERPLRELIDQLQAGGWQTGLHQSFDAWQSAELMRIQKNRLDVICDTNVSTCRQHWLRFSWADTWDAQETAGFREDTTLMFNDRPGLRTAAAVAYQPWNESRHQRHGLVALPTVLMDSHIYDYDLMSDSDRKDRIRRCLAEIKAVGGRCALLWHPHTLTDDYGWSDGFIDCIEIAGVMDICVTR